MMNLLGLGPLKKSPSSSNNENGESSSSPSSGSPVKKFFTSFGNNYSGGGKVKDKHNKDSNEKIIKTTATVEHGGGTTTTTTGTIINGKKGSESCGSSSGTTAASAAAAASTSISATKLKVQKASTSSSSSGGANEGKAKAASSTSSIIIPSSFGANGTAAAVVAGVIAGEDPGKKELEELKERATEVANESLASTRRMAEFCENAKDAGIKIIVALDDQKEQLDRIQDSLTVMREDLIHAEKNLRGMDKCCGIFNNPFKKTNFKEDEKLWTDGLDGVVLQENATVPRRPFTPAPTLGWPLNRGSSSKDQNQSNNLGAGGYIPKITEDEVEDEMEKNMDLVSSMLGNLRNMAIDMNTEIESQNKQMNVINDMTEQNNARIDDAIQKTHDLKRQ